MKDADVFVGLSVGNVVTPAMVKSMAKNPIVFAMANPDPEITWEAATAARKDVIMATGRSDYPNQVNNVLGFPCTAEARELFENMLACRNHLGLLSEDINPETNELWGNFPQTYPLVGIVNCAMKLSRTWEDVV
jgi:malic enzyme